MGGGDDQAEKISEYVLEALRNINCGNGASSVEIRCYIMENFPVCMTEKDLACYVKEALKKLICVKAIKMRACDRKYYINPCPPPCPPPCCNGSNNKCGKSNNKCGNSNNKCGNSKNNNCGKSNKCPPPCCPPPPPPPCCPPCCPPSCCQKKKKKKKNGNGNCKDNGNGNGNGNGCPPKCKAKNSCSKGAKC